MNTKTTLITLFSLFIQASAFQQSNPTLDRLVLREMSQLSASASDNDLATQLSRYQKREPISNDRVFFIELGFGKITNHTSDT